MGGQVPTQGIFPTFFISGFECSTFEWGDVGRRDLGEETRHREHAAEDYAMLASLGIAVAREGVAWPFVDRGGAFDFSRVEPLLEAAADRKIVPIWDLCHYGYPDDITPASPDFAERFANYAEAFARFVRERSDGPFFFTPVNEITFFAFAGGAWGWIAPFGRGREARDALRLALVRAAIAGSRGIREQLPEARLVHIDPLVNIVAPLDRPDLVEAARKETYDDTFLAWDAIAGRRHAELGGDPSLLDIVGVNVYSFGQMEYRGLGPHEALPPDDPRIRPLADMLADVWNRYERPLLIAETSGLKDGRTEWLRDVMQESLAAVYEGIDLHGVCLFPAVDMPDWHTGEWLHSGICDLVEDGDDLRRVVDQDYVAELRRWQERLNRTTELDEDPLSDPVDLDDVRAAAERMRLRGDADWR
jgi:beta-glucosidase/6-phospho-beta-glucosidase/beta-galactosidase